MLTTRVEITALAALLVEKGVITVEEFQTQVEREAAMLNEMYEHAFPGMRATESGIVHYDQAKALKTTEGWPL